MAHPGTLAPAQTAPRDKDAAPAALVPFVRAAQEHLEAFLDTSVPLSAGSSTQITPADVPAYGFMRGIFLEVSATGGAGASVFKADAPFSVLDEVSISDVNGANIIGPLSGHDVYLVNKFGGYRRGTTNPRLHPDFTQNTANGNFSFLFYLPIEVNGRDGLGSLANLNAASSYKVRANVSAASAVYSTAPTTLPTIRVKAYLDAWTQPSTTDLRGRAQATTPPAHGTTAYWSRTVQNVSAGQQTIKLPRVGNLVRNLIFVFRDAAGVRSEAGFPGVMSTYWDSRLLKEYGSVVWRGQMSQRYGLTGANDAATGIEAGVRVDDFCHEFDGLAGFEMRDGWLPTLQSTRLDLTANFSAPGTLTILTNDVAPAGDGVFL